jgi:hypothetical protein
MLKEKFGHLIIPGKDPNNEWPELQDLLKNTRAAMAKYKKEGCGRFLEELQYYELLVAAGVSVCGSPIKWTPSHSNVGA